MASSEHGITIDATGRVRFVWDDELAGLLSMGSPTIARASHVEPTSDGQWTADMSPVGGETLGPFALRGEALAAEREWLERHGY